MNHLLMGKTALISRKPKRTSPVIQSATRANFDPRKVLRNRSNTVANLWQTNNTTINNNKNESKSNSRKNSDKIDVNNKEKITSVTLSWTQIKLEKKRQKFQRKLSEPVLGSFQESSQEDCSINTSCAVDDNSVQLDNDKNRSTEMLNNSSSSSSTELCDDHLNDNLSDLASSPEVHRKTRLSANEQKQSSTEANNNYNNENNNRETTSVCCEASNDSNDCLESNQINEKPLSADQCLTTNNNCECDKSSLDYGHRSQPTTQTPITDNAVNSVDTGTDDNSSDAYSTIKREISELSLEQCIQKLNEKLISLNDDNIKQ